MKFDQNVPPDDRAKIDEALQAIKLYGNARHAAIARLITDSEISIHLGLAENVGGSGSVSVSNALAVNWAIAHGEISFFDAWRFVRLNIARETIDDGGQRGIEGTFVHEGKHASDFALMISSFSSGAEIECFNPTAFQREYSAHLTSAFYLKRRGGEYAAEGFGLGILFQNEGGTIVNPAGIQERLNNNYSLSTDAPGQRLSELSFPCIVPRGTKLWGIF